MRRPLVAGNWKMNLDLAGGRALVAALAGRMTPPPPLDVAVFPPFIYLSAAAEALSGTALALGAQNLWPEPSGAFTGEVSAAMLKETGCTYVLVGHSERRHTIGGKDATGRIIGEDDELVNRKVRAALSAGLTPIVCVGETLEERDGGRTEVVLARQVDAGLAGLEDRQVAGLLVAYEPVWAIGTGRNATPRQADEAHREIRSRIGSGWGEEAAGRVRVLYGGSVKAVNAEELARSGDVDGVLVGGASLAAEEFCGIIKGCLRAKGLVGR